MRTLANNHMNRLNNNTKIKRRFCALLLMLCVFLGGCRFDGIFHRINESIDGISLTEEAETSNSANELLENEVFADSIKVEETRLTENVEVTDTAMPLMEETTAEIIRSAPAQLRYLDIFELFRIGDRIDKDAVTNNTVVHRDTIRVSGQNYAYSACTEMISREDLGEFFYSGKVSYGNNKCAAFIYEYPEIGSSNLLRRKPLLLTNDRYLYHYSFDCKAIRITFAFEITSVKENRQKLTRAILENTFNISPLEDIPIYMAENIDNPEDLRFVTCDSDKIINQGAKNLLGRARQQTTIQYELQGNLPAQVSGGVIPASNQEGVPTKLIGLPYSSCRAVDKMINHNVSTYTFLTAIHNPKSVLYTHYLCNSNARTFYGTVCSAFSDYSQGILWNLPSLFLRSDRFGRAYQKKDSKDISIGDVFINYTHVILVTDLYRDADWNIRAVEYSEAKIPFAMTTTVPYSKFVQDMDKEGYECFGYKGISFVKYVRNPYVAAKESETVENIDYPDIMCEFGDKAVLMGGSNSAAEFERQVTINVLDAVDYYAIEIYRDSVHPIDYNRSESDYVLLETRTEV